MSMQPPAASLGHIALHYGPREDGPLAARLLGMMGLIETQMIPLPQGNFYRFVVDGKHHERGDGIVYLSALPEAQARLIAAIRERLGLGTAQEHEAVTAFRAGLATDFEFSFHIGFLVQSLEALEAMMLGLIEAERNDPDLKGRLRFGFNRARPGNAAIDARLDASPVFGQVERYAYGAGGVQAFVETDLLISGQLGESTILEFDYVFPDSASHILSVVEM